MDGTMQDGAADDRFEELVRLVRKHATEEGTNVTALPGLWFFRVTRRAEAKVTRSTTMYLGVAVQGRKRMRVGGRELIYDRKNYLVLRGETEYAAAPIEASAGKPYLALGLHLPPEVVVRTLLDVVDGGGASPAGSGLRETPAFISPLDDGLVDALCRLLGTLGDTLSRRVLAPLIVQEIVFRLLCTDAAGVLRSAVSRNGEHERIRAAMAFIDENAHEPLTVEVIAKRLAMSPSHFAHRFKEIASVSPIRYQKHVRLTRARELLLSGGLGAGLIAERVGYASASHFIRDFKRHYGLSPAKYARAFEHGEAAGPTAAGASSSRSPFAGSGNSTAASGLGVVTRRG